MALKLQDLRRIVKRIYEKINDRRLFKCSKY